MRKSHILVMLLSAQIIAIVWSQPALAGKFAYVSTNQSQAGIRADVKTPASALTGVPGGTTVKLGLYVGDGANTNTGWLVRPGEFNNPISYYIYRSGGDHTVYFVPMSPQSYNSSRAFQLSHEGGSGWGIYVVQSYRATSFEVISGQRPLYVGGKTSADNANLRGSVFNGNYDVGGNNWYWLTSNYSYKADNPPLYLSVSSPNHAFSVYNSNF